MIMPWGKYEGEDMEDIPSSYLRWIMNNVDDQEVVEAAEAEMAYRDDHNAHLEG